jgi:carbon-monoxide dehydrogenase medium subunit
MRFEYLEPHSVEEAVSLLVEHDGKAEIIAGGTDLINKIRLKLTRPEYVVDIGNVPGLDYIRSDAEGGLSIGALTAIRALEKSNELQKNHPMISQATGLLGSAAIRNVGTVGGNLCNAAPSAETAPPLIASGAKLKILGPDGERTVALEDFFTGPGQTVLETAEVMVEIRVPPMPPHTRGVYLKHAIRGMADLAVSGVAAIATMDGEICKDAKIVLGAVAPTPMRAKKAEAMIMGEKVDDSLIEKAARTASDESRPTTDVRASAEYRKEMVKVFTRYALKRVIHL